MKKAVVLVLTVILTITIVLSGISVSALSGTSSASVSNKTPGVGSNITVTFSVNVGEAFTMEYYCKYTDNLQFVSTSSGDTNSIATGIIKAVEVVNTTKYSATYTFKTVSAGNATVSFYGTEIANGEIEVSVGDASVSLSIGSNQTNNQTTPSDNSSANLKSLSVTAGTLTPSFSPDVTLYNVTVQNSVTDGIMYCQTANGLSTIKIEGERQLSVGKNKRSIIVTSPSGAVKTYTVVFNRLDENGKDVSEPDKATAVNVGDKKYFMSDNAEAFTVPSGLILSTATYNDTEYPVLTDSAERIKAFYLVSEDGTDEGFFTLDESGNFTKMNIFETRELAYIILPITDTIGYSGLTKSTYTLDNAEVDCYRYDNVSYSDFVIFNAISPSGNTGYYKYDTVEGTFQRINISENALETQKITDYDMVQAQSVLIVIAVTVILILLIAVLLIVLLIKQRKIKKIINEQQEQEAKAEKINAEAIDQMIDLAVKKESDNSNQDF